MITPSWLSWSLRSFSSRSSVYSCHIFQSVLLLLDPFHFCPLPCLLAWNIPLILNFLEEMSSFFHSIFFSLFLCIVHWRRPSYLSLLFSGTLHLAGYVWIYLQVFKKIIKNEVIKAGLNPVWLASLLKEESWTQTHTKGRPCEDTGRRRPSISQRDKPQKKSTLLTPWSYTSNPQNLWQEIFII